MLEVLTLVHMASSEHYSIKQVSEMSGLPSSTLRYYESIGIIPVISRDSSSKQRVYSEDDLGFIKNVACLYGLGLSITDMRDYLTNMAGATPVHAHNQVALLQRQAETLEEEAVLECVGSRDATETAFAIARPGAIVGRVGLPHEAPIDEVGTFFRNVGTRGGPAPVREYLPELLRATLAGEINPGEVFDYETDLDHIDEAYQAMDGRRAIKALIRVSEV